MDKIYIEPEKDKKGRTFGATLLGWINAPAFLEGGSGDNNTHRPLWMAYACTEGEARPFTANLLLGRPAQERKSVRYQFLKSAGFRTHQQKGGGGIITTIYQPTPFQINPGMVDPNEISFIMLPPAEWKAKQRNPAEAEALLFLAYLDRRCRFPFPPDATFARRLLDRCIKEGMASYTQDHYGRHTHRFTYREYGLGALGLAGLAFQTSHARFGAVLSEEILEWLK